MYTYTFVQWILFFYLYSFVGWVWESVYVSLKKKKWINRGFMTGPFLPIYGFGAISILFAAIPVKENIIYIYILGMLAATLLEYITGVVMEKLFKVRYWDYSEERFNIKGHICLKSSLAWGIFSILLIRVIHQPFEKIIFEGFYSAEEIFAVLLSIGVSVDVGLAVRDALDLKDMLMRMKENAEELIDLQRHMDMLANKWNDEKKQFKNRVEQFQENIMDDEKSSIGRVIDNIKDRIDILEQFWFKSYDMRSEYSKEIKDELDSMKERIFEYRMKIDFRNRRMKNHIKRLLNRNPDAVSQEYKDALEEIKDIEK